MGRLLTNLVWAVILLIRFTEFALQTRPDLGTDTNAVPDFDGSHFVTDLNGLTNDLMANADWKRAFSPTPGDSMNV